MRILWICLALAVAVVNAQQENEDWDPEQWDYYDNAYDSPLVYDDNLKELVEKIFDENEQQPQDQEIANDYQIEDNRSSHNDDVASKENNEQSSQEENANDEVVAEAPQNDDVAVENDNSELKEAAEFPPEDDETYMDDKQDVEKDQSNQDSLNMDEEETQNVDVIEEKIENEESDVKSPDDYVLEETKRLLSEMYDDFDDQKDVSQDQEKELKLLKDEDMADIEEDTVDKVYQDLNADLDKLMETWKKLNADVDPEENPDDAFDVNEASQEDKQTSASEEQVDDAVKADPENKEEQISEDDKNSKAESVEQINDDKDDGFEADNDDTVQENIVEENIVDENDAVINYVKSAEVDDEENEDDASDEEGSYEDVEKDDDEEDNADDEEFSNNDDTIDKVGDKIEETNDASLFNLKDDSFVAKSEAPQTTITESTITEESSSTVRSIDVKELTSEQYTQLMTQFRMAHSEIFELNGDESDNVAPIHMTLSLDEATVVTSPNYPAPYPTNNVVDWMFVGDGVGIELNITDFAVNGALGDYLLVKPGGVDASGTDGLVFSYQLREPRLYRFLDVSRMFVRFVSLPGMAFNRGFSFSARMIAPMLTMEDDIPQPEAVLPEPVHTSTLHIGGLTLEEFRVYLEEFRLLLADMATLYINANDIDPGMNATREITQIVRTGVCNINWPGYEVCSRVTFSVPLVYEADEDPRLTEEDLRDMWTVYRDQDPFASRLRRMGMIEFDAPNDTSAAVVWAMVGLAFVMFMTLLGLALWRFSCFDNYSRMPQYSDRDSVYSAKQGLDLYPTPHQTLPPLFADEGKWEDDTARVDMGGFANKSYTRDMYDMDSDDDIIIAPRPDRNAGPEKNAYEV